MKTTFLIRTIFIIICISHSHTNASDNWQRSRLLATGGATTIEGAAGGGIVPMAVLSSYGSQEEWGATAFASVVDTNDYQLQVIGASVSLRNRIELSLAQQTLKHESLSTLLGLSDDTIQQNILGVKIRLAGDLIYTDIPQITLGAQFKKNEDFFIPSAAGARYDSGEDIYLSGSKLVLGGFFQRNWLLNATLRYTNANQLGLVGFGGDKNNDSELMTELSSGVFINKHWLVGAEYRQKPDNLSFAKEDDWYTGFVAWFPTKRITVVGAYVDLGEVATFADQTGWYLSLQGSF